jgi:hypothetical protein
MAFPVIYDFDCYEGDTHTFNVVVKGLNDTNFLALARAGTTYTFSIANERSASASFKTTGYIIATTDLISCTISGSLTPGQYVYSVRQNQPAFGGGLALVYTFVTGTITVKSKVPSI